MCVDWDWGSRVPKSVSPLDLTRDEGHGAQVVVGEGESRDDSASSQRFTAVAGGPKAKGGGKGNLNLLPFF